MGQQNDADQPESDIWYIPGKINRRDKSTNKIMTHVAEYETKKPNQSKDNMWHIN